MEPDAFLSGRGLVSVLAAPLRALPEDRYGHRSIFKNGGRFPVSHPLALHSASPTATTTMQFIRVFATLLAFGKQHQLGLLQSMVPYQSYCLSCCLRIGWPGSRQI